jgi:hypothetical protein
MIADFDKVFGKRDEDRISIPEEILENINKELPNNLFCYKDSEKGVIISPKPEKELQVKVELDPDETLRERLKNIPKEKWTDYFYRTQQRVRVKNVCMGDENKKIPIEQIGYNPLAESPKIVENYMYPEKFPEPFQMPIETPDGEKIILEIQRQPYDSMVISKYINVNYPAVKLEMLINEENIEQSKLTYSITPSKANTVTEALAVIRVYKYLQNGEALIDGKKVFSPTLERKQIDSEQLSKWDDFWSCLKKLEELLSVSFDPSVELTEEDALFMGQLEDSLIKGKIVKWKHPFDHLHVQKIDMKSGTIEEVVGKGKIEFGFMEGPIEASLMGADFQLYSETWMRDFVITGIEWDDESHAGAEMYIADEGNDCWILTRKYMTEDEYTKRNGKGIRK